MHKSGPFIIPGMAVPGLGTKLRPEEGKGLTNERGNLMIEVLDSVDHRTQQNYGFVPETATPFPGYFISSFLKRLRKF